MPTRRFDIRDFNVIAEEIVNLWDQRKAKRKDLERQWDEVDRQIRMEPDLTFKKFPKSENIDPAKAWLPEMELPLQKQASEVLVADTNRMIFPDVGAFFLPHAELTDEFLENAEGIKLIEGERVPDGEPAISIAGTGDFPLDDNAITQDEADKIVQGVLTHNHRQYGFRENVDLINAEAFKYGTGLGRGKTVTKEVHLNTSSGVLKETQKIPMLVPRSIRNTYLDDSLHAQMNEGLVVGPGIVSEWSQKLVDLKMAANRGSSDPNSETGGWMPAALKGMEGAEKDHITLLEFEGDLVVSRKHVSSLFIPGVIVTVARGKAGKSASLHRVVRLRFRQSRYGSYVEFPYHHEGIGSPYATAPLVGGMHIQKSAVQALNVFHQAAQLNALPPVSYDRSDTTFAQEGGPVIEPRALWGTIGKIEVQEFGNPAAILQAYLAFIQQYADYTGINAARLGAQTVSHTTAFAKEAELSRGTVRTVDYARNTLKGPLTRWLYMEFELTKKAFRGEQTIYLEPYKSFVTMNRKAIPENAVFEVFGAGGPSEQRARTEARMNAVQQAIQIDGFKLQAGLQPSLNYDEIQKQILAEGGWPDVDALIQRESALAGATDGPALEGGAGGDRDTEAALLQAIGG